MPSKGYAGRGREDHVNVAAIIATLVGLGGYLVSQAYPGFIFGVPGIAAGAVVHMILWKAAGDKLGTAFRTKPSGAESEDPQSSIAVNP